MFAIVGARCSFARCSLARLLARVLSHAARLRVRLASLRTACRPRAVGLSVRVRAARRGVLWLAFWLSDGPRASSNQIHSVNFQFLKSLKLKTLVKLTPEEPLPATISFCDENQINLVGRSVGRRAPVSMMTGARRVGARRAASCDSASTRRCRKPIATTGSRSPTSSSRRRSKSCSTDRSIPSC